MAYDFDFLTGTWDVHNRKLVKPLTGSTDWEQFPGRSVARSIFGGSGNTDEITFPTMGWSGYTLRLFDADEQTWSLRWVSSRRNVIDPPVVGRFVDGRGEFFGDDTHADQPIRVRYVWSGITPTTARWEQAFSIDSEKTAKTETTWELNWIMDLRRVGD